MSQNVSELLGASMAKVREMVDANTVVGTPISAGDGTTRIPSSKISFAMASGGSDLKPKAATSALPFGGGAGCGDDIVEAARAGADAVACAAVLHYEKETVPELKEEIRSAGVEGRSV